MALDPLDFLQSRDWNRTHWDEPVQAYLRATNPLPTFSVRQEWDHEQIFKAVGTAVPKKRAGSAAHTPAVKASPAATSASSAPDQPKGPHHWVSMVHSPASGVPSAPIHMALGIGGAAHNKVIAGPKALHGVHLGDTVGSMPDGHRLSFESHSSAPQGYNSHPDYAVADAANLPNKTKEQAGPALHKSIAALATSAASPASPSSAGGSTKAVVGPPDRDPVEAPKVKLTSSAEGRQPNLGPTSITHSVNPTGNIMPGVAQQNLPLTQQKKQWREAHEAAIHSPTAKKILNQYREPNGTLSDKVGFARRRHIRTLLDALPTFVHRSGDPSKYQAEMEGVKAHLRNLAAPDNRKPVRIHVGEGLETVSPMSLAHAHQIVEHYQKHGTFPHWWHDYDSSNFFSRPENTAVEPAPPADESQYFQAPSTPGTEKLANKRGPVPLPPGFPKDEEPGADSEQLPTPGGPPAPKQLTAASGTPPTTSGPLQAAPNALPAAGGQPAVPSSSLPPISSQPAAPSAPYEASRPQFVHPDLRGQPAPVSGQPAPVSGQPAPTSGQPAAISPPPTTASVPTADQTTTPSTEAPSLPPTSGPVSPSQRLAERGQLPTPGSPPPAPTSSLPPADAPSSLSGGIKTPSQRLAERGQLPASMVPPTTVSGQPAASSGQPAASSGQPAASSEQPAAISPPPPAAPPSLPPATQTGTPQFVHPDLQGQPVPLPADSEQPTAAPPSLPTTSEPPAAVSPPPTVDSEQSALPTTSGQPTTAPQPLPAASEEPAAIGEESAAAPTSEVTSASSTPSPEEPQKEAPSPAPLPGPAVPPTTSSPQEAAVPPAPASGQSTVAPKPLPTAPARATTTPSNTAPQVAPPSGPIPGSPQSTADEHNFTSEKQWAPKQGATAEELQGHLQRLQPVGERINANIAQLGPNHPAAAGLQEMKKGHEAAVAATQAQIAALHGGPTPTNEPPPTAPSPPAAPLPTTPPPAGPPANAGTTTAPPAPAKRPAPPRQSTTPAQTTPPPVAAPPELPTSPTATARAGRKKRQSTAVGEEPAPSSEEPAPSSEEPATVSAPPAAVSEQPTTAGVPSASSSELSTLQGHVKKSAKRGKKLKAKLEGLAPDAPERAKLQDTYKKHITGHKVLKAKLTALQSKPPAVVQEQPEAVHTEPPTSSEEPKRRGRPRKATPLDEQNATNEEGAPFKEPAPASSEQPAAGSKPPSKASVTRARKKWREDHLAWARAEDLHPDEDVGEGPPLQSAPEDANKKELRAHMGAHARAEVRTRQLLASGRVSLAERPAHEAKMGRHRELYQESRERLGVKVKDKGEDVQSDPSTRDKQRQHWERNKPSRNQQAAPMVPTTITARDTERIDKLLTDSEKERLSPSEQKTLALEREDTRSKEDTRPYYADAPEDLPEPKYPYPQDSESEAAKSRDRELLHHYTRAWLVDLGRRHAHEARHHAEELQSLMGRFARDSGNPRLHAHMNDTASLRRAHGEAATQIWQRTLDSDKAISDLHGTYGPEGEKWTAPHGAGGDQKKKWSIRRKRAEELFGEGRPFDPTVEAKLARRISRGALIKHETPPANEEAAKQQKQVFNHAPFPSLPSPSGLTDAQMLWHLNRMRGNAKLSHELMGDLGETYVRAINQKQGRKDFDPFWGDEPDTHETTAVTPEELQEMYGNRHEEAAPSPTLKPRATAANNPERPHILRTSSSTGKVPVWMKWLGGVEQKPEAAPKKLPPKSAPASPDPANLRSLQRHFHLQPVGSPEWHRTARQIGQLMQQRQAATRSEEPAAVSEQPATKSEQLPAKSEEPTTKSEQPAAPKEEPAAVSEQPATKSEELPAKKEEPAAAPSQSIVAPLSGKKSSPAANTGDIWAKIRPLTEQLRSLQKGSSEYNRVAAQIKELDTARKAMMAQGSSKPMETAGSLSPTLNTKGLATALVKALQEQNPGEDLSGFLDKVLHNKEQ